ncbi:GH92 family glycosyl hydrolase [Thermopolyspora sp. NPDC052614]|uniref:GH92 family glycosyl hydrolase n=1 Tax=Thermopolyspora sp. NPDC052614 TaxID=3155682 RepID=UPI00342A61D8
MILALPAMALSSAASPSPVPNPGVAATPTPGPSYSPAPEPTAKQPPPAVSEETARSMAATGRDLAKAEGTDFYSSFEPGDPAPAWTDTVETDAKGRSRVRDVTDTPIGGIPGNIIRKIDQVTASGENLNAGEIRENAADGDSNTKWLVFTDTRTGWLAYRLTEPTTVVHYAITSANDIPDRDPRDWQVQGSQDGRNWTTLDTRTGETFDARFQRKEYRFENTTAYAYYRLNITANRGAGIIQLAEWELSDGSTAPKPPFMRSRAGEGPPGGFDAAPRAGFSGLRALQYGGGVTGANGGHAYAKVFDVDIPVRSGTELSYVVFPAFTNADLRYQSTYVAVDLAFSDGTYLSDLHAKDQHGVELTPRAQGESKTLYADQWNHKAADIGKVARGKRIKRILVGYDSPVGQASFRGWVDDIKIVTERKRQPYQAFGPHRDTTRPADYVITTRGTQSTGGFSRGNNFPATAVPHGFNFWTPMTDAGSVNWLYEYHRANDATNLPRIEAFSASHEPSPWMGDRQTFQVMPSIAAGTPDPNRDNRAMAFRHENETAKPYHYAVTFENKLKAEIAPADHAAMLRFTYPGDQARLIFDNVNNNGGLTLDTASGVVTGYSDVRSDNSTGATRMFYYAVFDRPVTGGGKLTGQGRDNVLGHLAFDAGPERAVTMRIASSLISVEQAKHNLELEIPASDTFEKVKERARRAWDDKLGVIEVEGAREDQLVTLYSNLYRLFLYPNSAFENTGTARKPVYRHAVQSATSTPPSSPTETGAPVVDGKVYVNNGFWDTYRTTWPAYALLTPTMAGELADGFVQQYRDGGWIARWSSPGYADLMVGTSSDVAFADAYLKGVTGFDAKAAYEAAVKNATVVPPNRFVGRKGLSTSQFLGYTSIQSTGEAMSWALDGYINDFGIANMAKELAKHAKGKERTRYLEESEYFLNRALNYVHMFDPAVRFFQGRNADGTWHRRPGTFDPRNWGEDYTETNAWNMAFHTPQDGRGLANLYGGRAKLAEKLDAFFATPETATFPGGYGGIIHEMREARDVRMGQYGHSNQPSHHIMYMYDHAGQPWKTQEKVREALSRLYLGSEIGQGYPGDEDNGEMSAWQIFSALGFYPLAMGSPTYAIGSPLFTKATINLENGRKLVIRAPGNSDRNVYVQGVRVNGRRWDKTYLPHEAIARGGEIVFDMGPRPSRWGTGKDAAPPSITQNDELPEPLRDATGPGRGTASAGEGVDPARLFDDNASTQVSLPGAQPTIGYRFADRQPVRYYTLTSGSGQAQQDPTGWVLEGSADGTTWTKLDERDGEAFPWRLQTRPFKLAKPAAYAHYRLRVTGNGGAATTTIAEVELLNGAAAETSPLVTEAENAAAAPGSTASVRVTVINYAEGPATGTITATAPEGWTVEPADQSFGPVAPGQNAAFTFQVRVPQDATPGTWPINLSITSDRGSATARALVVVIGDTITFTPGTDAETFWLFDAGSSQLDGEVHDGRARFTDGDARATYRFTLPEGVTGGTLALDIGNQFLVEVSTDGQNWRTVLTESQNIRDLSNRSERTLDLNDLRDQSQTLYVRIGDSRPEDGWGAWLARMTLTMTR